MVQYIFSAKKKPIHQCARLMKKLYRRNTQRTPLRSTKTVSEYDGNVRERNVYNLYISRPIGWWEQVKLFWSHRQDAHNEGLGKQNGIKKYFNRGV